MSSAENIASEADLPSTDVSGLPTASQLTTSLNRQFQAQSQERRGPTTPGKPSLDVESGAHVTDAGPDPDPNFQSSIEEVWYLKEITFRPNPHTPPRRFKIITQNFNG